MPEWMPSWVVVLIGRRAGTITVRARDEEHAASEAARAVGDGVTVLTVYRHTILAP